MNLFDIETAALPETEIAHLCPEFEPPGNFKDPEKIKANLEAQKAKWLEDAALSAITGKVLCIGILRFANTTGKHVFELLEGDESSLLETFWGMYTTGDYDKVKWVGFNNKGFDLPFLIQRSWKHRVAVPPIFIGRYYCDRIIDLMERFGCGQYRGAISLDHLAKFLGIGQKNGKGADFAKLYALNRDKAVEYLQNDLELIRKCAEIIL